MRFDDIGMFWQDLPSAKGRSTVQRPMPEIPETGWRTPSLSDLPNLRDCPVIALDVETFDPNLVKKGPGWARNDGHIVGLAIAAKGGGKWYFPMRHEVRPEENLPPEKVLEWARDNLSGPQVKVGANLLYDVGWLKQEGVDVGGKLIDVQYAEALLVENGSIALETIAQKYLNEGKESPLLYQWLDDYYGGGVGPKQRANIYRSPPCLAGPYAVSDVDLPLRLAPILYKELSNQGLLEVYDMECLTIPLLVKMRMKGVRVDVKKAEEVRGRLEESIEEEKKHLNKIAGTEVNVNAGASLANAFEANGLHVPINPKTNKPSFDKNFLKSVKHPLASQILEVRRLTKVKTTFLESYIINGHTNGRLHCQFHPLKGQGNGAVSGRFASSTPNLQNIPSRDPVYGPLIRSLFVPDEGHRQWRKYDYSQIEYRFLAHFAVGKGSELIVEKYRLDPKTDYHVATSELIKEATNIELGRKETKNINFGLVYGMGIDALAMGLGLTRNEAKNLFSSYHKGAPFVKETMDLAMSEAEHTGIITTFLGRRSRFDLWEADDWNNKGPALTLDKAIRAYGRVRRAGLHKALNRRLQGSAADLLKVGMLQCYESGVFDVTGIPLLTVHDELDFSDPQTRESEQGFREMKNIMENCIKLKIPIVCEGEVGPNWGDLSNLLDN